MTGWDEIERRRLWDRSVAAKALAGQFIANDPLFLDWVEEWIGGAITMAEVQRRYCELLALKSKFAISDEE